MSHFDISESVFLRLYCSAHSQLFCPAKILEVELLGWGTEKMLGRLHISTLSCGELVLLFWCIFGPTVWMPVFYTLPGCHHCCFTSIYGRSIYLPLVHKCVHGYSRILGASQLDGTDSPQCLFCQKKTELSPLTYNTSLTCDFARQCWPGFEQAEWAVCRVCGSEWPDWGQGGWMLWGMKRPLTWETAKALYLGDKKNSHPLIIILNYKNYPTIKLFQTTSYNLVISPSPSPGQLATF